MLLRAVTFLLLCLCTTQFQSLAPVPIHTSRSSKISAIETSTLSSTQTRVTSALDTTSSEVSDSCIRASCPEPDIHVKDEETRREVLFSMLGAATAVASSTMDKAFAAIPIYSEDYDPKPNLKAKQVPTGPAKPPAPDVAFSKTKDVKGRLVIEAAYLCKLVDAGSWDSVRNYIREPGSYLHDTKKSSLEIRGPVQELEDFSLSVRTIFFNEEDKSQVLKMEEDSGYSDEKNVKEGKRLLMEVVDGISAMV
ncbi:hypothetical protein TrLO_g6902 [Triparma laevis f. longispina]|uniref:Uncharacterized protein n=1 Tax=Triparma laevis f. longispina TaxID=1714387 RepID=A0A9W7BZG0_9STRA|nr:hypothetical protein TrLO_g6902 [Triparma laevis f. longispina]